MDEMKIERQTYSALEWLGDIGGLFDMLKLLGYMIVIPFSSFGLRSELLSGIFRYISSLRKAKDNGNFYSQHELQYAEKDGKESQEMTTLDL